MKYKTDEERRQSHNQVMKNWRAKNKKHTQIYDSQEWRKAQHKEYCRRKKEEFSEIIGKQCIFCKWNGGETQKDLLHFHEIHGKSHPKSLKYIREHINDFVTLCCSCHRAIHWCMKYFQMTWDEIYNKYSQKTKKMPRKFKDEDED